MGSANENELQLTILAAGQQLQNPPCRKPPLLEVLDKLEISLSMVNPSPRQSMIDAMRPSIDALVNPWLVRSRHWEVRLQVLHCLIRITNIMAPNEPFDNDVMKDILALVVESFKELGNMDSPSFAIRVSLLKTVSELQACVIMLDLELNDLIIEMIKHFFLAVTQNSYSADVHESMQTIMSLILDESDDISPELVSVLRKNLTREMKESSADAYSLATKVVTSCAEKLRPFDLKVEE